MAFLTIRLLRSWGVRVSLRETKRRDTEETRRRMCAPCGRFAKNLPRWCTSEPVRPCGRFRHDAWPMGTARPGAQLGSGRCFQLPQCPPLAPARHARPLSALLETGTASRWSPFLMQDVDRHEEDGRASAPFSRSTHAIGTITKSRLRARRGCGLAGLAAAARSWQLPPRGSAANCPGRTDRPSI